MGVKGLDVSRRSLLSACSDLQWLSVVDLPEVCVAENVCSPTEEVEYALKHEPRSWTLGLAAQIPRWPDLERWADFVVQFNQRKLTFDEDVVDAFSGATSAFNHRFSGGILWGIPEMFFDYCILWKPKSALRRRTTPSVATLPSWSWVGWKGEIILVGTWPIINNYPRTDNQCVRIQPMVEWYKIRTLTTNPVSVKNIYHYIQRTYSNSEIKSYRPVGHRVCILRVRLIIPIVQCRRYAFVIRCL